MQLLECLLPITIGLLQMDFGKALPYAHHPLTRTSALTIIAQQFTDRRLLRGIQLVDETASADVGRAAQGSSGQVRAGQKS